MIEGAVASALKKHLGRNANVICAIDPETAEVGAKLRKKVVETVTMPEAELTLEALGHPFGRQPPMKRQRIVALTPRRKPLVAAIHTHREVGPRLALPMALRRFP